MKIHNSIRFQRRAFDLWTANRVTNTHESAGELRTALGNLEATNAQLASTLMNEGLCTEPPSRQVIKAAVNKEQKRRSKIAALPKLDQAAANRAQAVQELQIDIIEALNGFTPDGADIGDALKLRQAVAKHDALAPTAGPLAEAVEMLTGAAVTAAHYESNPRLADIRTQVATLFPATAGE